MPTRCADASGLDAAGRARLAPVSSSAVSDAQDTCWTLIRAAAEGESAARERFARDYLPLVRAYLGARWGGRLCADELADAAQEMFVECLRAGGLLERARPGAGSGFRGFLLGAARNVARRIEERRARRPDAAGSKELAGERVAADEESLGALFDREWARVLVRQAARAMEEQAGRDPAALREVELLRLRFRDGRSIAEIAREWQVDAAELHNAYARARRTFRGCLHERVAFHHPGQPERVRDELERLLELVA